MNVLSVCLVCLFWLQLLIEAFLEASEATSEAEKRLDAAQDEESGYEDHYVRAFQYALSFARTNLLEDALGLLGWSPMVCDSVQN